MTDEIIRLALNEDGRDITSEAVLPEGATLRAVMIAKAGGVMAGLEVAERVFALTDPGIACSFDVSDGDEVSAGQRLAVITGPARAILKAERVALNFLQRLSGIATLTRRYVDAIRDTEATILDTRKTT
ncbi:MAG TPA: nicotinate-nucleotide diphosphorylase (carboxylating), partial [Desulfomonilia bacterium]|nr:nicotinate-nucleotide diphosphorylase (carboxylating) [Desulfomonilia bacterium]